MKSPDLKHRERVRRYLMHSTLPIEEIAALVKDPPEKIIEWGNLWNWKRPSDAQPLPKLRISEKNRSQRKKAYRILDQKVVSIHRTISAVVVAARLTRSPPPDRKMLVSHLWRAAARQVSEAQARHLSETTSASAEKEARVLGALARVVEKLDELDRVTPMKNAKTHSPPQEEPHDAFPTDIEALRRELAQRLDQLRQQATPAKLRSDAGS